MIKLLLTSNGLAEIDEKKVSNWIRNDRAISELRRKLKKDIRKGKENTKGSR